MQWNYDFQNKGSEADALIKDGSIEYTRGTIDDTQFGREPAHVKNDV